MLENEQSDCPGKRWEMLRGIQARNRGMCDTGLDRAGLDRIALL